MSILEVKNIIDKLPAENLVELEAYIRDVKERTLQRAPQNSREERFEAAKDKLFSQYDYLLSELAK